MKYLAVYLVLLTLVLMFNHGAHKNDINDRKCEKSAVGETID